MAICKTCESLAEVPPQEFCDRCDKPILHDCSHTWIYPRNERIKSGRWCTECGKIEGCPEDVITDKQFDEWKRECEESLGGTGG